MPLGVFHEQALELFKDTNDKGSGVNQNQMTTTEL